MAGRFITRGFKGRRRQAGAPNLPPGQYQTSDFPVLSAGPTPRTPLESWTFTISGAIEQPRHWSWDEFKALPRETITVDIHCVTKWSKFGTVWEGVPVAQLLEQRLPQARFVIAHCDGGYTTNLPLADVLDGRAWIVDTFDGAPLRAEHGGPARLLVPHLYLWKSAKWIRGLHLGNDDQPGFWETRGYHNYGDPWREQRYQGD